MSEATYVGDELTLFKDAIRWKSYFASRLRPYLTGDVLEVGAGLGGTTRLLCDGSESSWVCLEPDPVLVAQLRTSIDEAPLPLRPEVIVGDLGDVDPDRRFDAILYIDVLEHIEDDTGELLRARDRLRDGGALIVLSPAFQFLFSEFDRAVGHFRRYTRSSLAAVFPEGMRKDRIFYLDSVGMLTSLLNRFVLKQGTPKPEQIRLWDRAIVPVSKVVDPCTFYSFGRSVIAVYRRVGDS